MIVCGIKIELFTITWGESGFNGKYFNKATWSLTINDSVYCTGLISWVNGYSIRLVFNSGVFYFSQILINSHIIDNLLHLFKISFILFKVTVCYYFLITCYSFIIIS